MTSIDIVQSHARGDLRFFVGAVALLGAVLAFAPDARAQKSGVRDVLVQPRVQVPPPVFNEAATKGLVIRGLDDTEGLGRVIGHILADRRLDRSLFDARIARLAGLDPKALRDIEQFVRGSHLAIERVELVPGLTDRAETTRPSAESQTLKPDGIVPGFPSGGSLVGVRHTTYTFNGGDDHAVSTQRYSDGSTWYTAHFERPDGSTMVHERTQTSDGTIQYEHVVVTDGQGRVTHESEQRQTEGVVSDAETARKEAATTAADTDDPEGGLTDGEEDIDQYQPGDDANGVFCPLAVEICRRGLQQALASGAKVRVGMVRVNPEDPDDTPQAPRLVYDPKDLVINPLRARQRNSSADPREFQMDIPVWVNPPGPGEE